VLARIERTNLILAALVTCLAGLVWGPRGAIGAGAGAALACADFYVLVRLVSRLTENVRAGGSATGLGLLLFVKTTVLFALVFVAIRVAHLSPIPFALGFSVFVISIVLFGLASLTRAEA
jgi:ATP synthase I subunit